MWDLSKIWQVHRYRSGLTCHQVVLVVLESSLSHIWVRMESIFKKKTPKGLISYGIFIKFGKWFDIQEVFRFFFFLARESKLSQTWVKRDSNFKKDINQTFCGIFLKFGKNIDTEVFWLPICFRLKFESDMSQSRV